MIVVVWCGAGCGATCSTRCGDGTGECLVCEIDRKGLLFGVVNQTVGQCEDCASAFVHSELYATLLLEFPKFCPDVGHGTMSGWNSVSGVRVSAIDVLSSGPASFPSARIKMRSPRAAGVIITSSGLERSSMNVVYATGREACYAL